MHCDLEVSKAPFAHIGALAARPHIIVVIHINIEDHLLLHWNKGLFVTCVVTVWRNIVDGSNIDLVRHFVNQRLPKVLCVLKAKVAAVDVVGEGKAELALVKVRRMSAII